MGRVGFVLLLRTWLMPVNSGASVHWRDIPVPCKQEDGKYYAIAHHSVHSLGGASKPLYDAVQQKCPEI